MPEAPAIESRPRLVNFGAFSFDFQNRLLSRAGTEIPLPPRVLAVLELLLERAGEVVSRQELLDQVWKDAFVTDTSLAEAVSFLRQGLGDDPQAPRYVQTVHRRGYRFLPPLTQPVARADTVITRPTVPEPLRPSIVRDLAPWSITVACTILAFTALWQTVRRPAPEPPPVVRFRVQPTAGTVFDRRAPALALARDGRTLAWSACSSSSGTCELYVQPIDRLEATRLRATEGALAPFFSPDGRWIGFFADGRLKKIATSGGSALTLANAPAPGGGSWAADGRIAFAGSPAGGLSITSDQGGSVEQLTTPRAALGEVRHLWPSWLADGRSIIFTASGTPLPESTGQLGILQIASGPWRSIRSGVTRAVPTGAGFLLLSAGADLQAQAFDERTMNLTGATDSVAEGIETARGVAQIAVSGGDALATISTPAAARQIVWADDPSRLLTSLEGLTALALSPDGRRAAGVSLDQTGSDIWIVDLARDSARRVTFGGTNVLPVWTPDGRLLFGSRSAGPFGVASYDESAGGKVETLIRADAQHLFPAAASSAHLAIVTGLPDGRTGIRITDRAGGEAQAFDDGPFDEAMPALSPDSAWLAFASDESGRWEVYVRRLPNGPSVAVSQAGGEQPAWSADGRSIYYHDGTRLLRCAFDPDHEPHTGSPAVVFERTDARVVAMTPTGRLLIEQQPATRDSAVVVLQWLRETRLRLPAPVTAPR